MPFYKLKFYLDYSFKAIDFKGLQSGFALVIAWLRVQLTINLISGN